MKTRPPFLPMLRLLLTSLLLIAGAGLAQGTQKIPDTALAGRYAAQSFPRVLIDRNEYQLAPGARLYNSKKQTITPNMLPAGAPVRYVLDARGHIQSLWVVTEDQLKDAQTRKPATERTGPQAQ